MTGPLAASPRRDAIRRSIEQHPGLSIRELASMSGITRTAVLHHVRALVRNGQVRTVRQGRRVTHFPFRVSQPEQRSLLGLLRLQTARVVIEELARDPAISWRRLARRLDVTPRAIRWHVRRLREEGILDLQEGPGGVHHVARIRADLVPLLAPPPMPTADLLLRPAERDMAPGHVLTRVMR